jgi:hypothetical protein
MRRISTDCLAFRGVSPFSFYFETEMRSAAFQSKAQTRVNQ